MSQWCVNVKAGSGSAHEIPILIPKFLLEVGAHVRFQFSFLNFCLMCHWCVSVKYVKVGSGRTGGIPILVLEFLLEVGVHVRFQFSFLNLYIMC